MNKFKNGWEITTPKDVVTGLLDVISSGPEQDTVIRIVSDLLSKAPDEVSWYFNEVHSGNDEACEEKVYAELPTDWDTVYDSSRLYDQADSGYNIIEIAYGDVETIDGKRVRNKFICLSLNGSFGASALSEYFKYQIILK